MASQSKRILLPLGAAAVFLYYIFVFAQQTKPLFAGMSDFSNFYTAGRLVDRGHGSLVYDRDAQWQLQSSLFKTVTSRKGPLLFIHPPFELLIFAPLALLPYARAVTVWFLFNLGLLTAVPILLRRKLELLRNHPVISFIAVAFFFPVSIALLQGQDSVLVLFLFTLAFLNLESGHDAAVGILLALAAVKPQLVLPILLIVLAMKKWRVLSFFLGTGVVLTGISSALVGWRTTLGFPLVLLRFNRLPAAIVGAYPETMPNLRGLLYATLGPSMSHGRLELIAAALSAALILVVGFACVSRRRSISDLEFCLLLVTALLLTYYLNGHDLTILMLPVFVAANYVAEHELTASRLSLGMAAGLVFILPSLLFAPAIMVTATLLFLALLLKESLYPEKLRSAYIPDDAPLQPQQEVSCP